MTAKRFESQPIQFQYSPGFNMGLSEPFRCPEKKKKSSHYIADTRE